MKKLTALASVLILSSGLALTACDNDRGRDLDRPGEAIEEGTNDLGRSVENGVDDVKDSAEDAGD